MGEVVETQDPLRVEKQFLKTNEAKLAAEYPGKYLVVQGENVIGAYDSYEDGVLAGAQALGVGPFLVRSVHRPDDDEALIIPTLALGLL